MLRKIHTSQSRKRFYHEQDHNNEQRPNYITRPPTSHPYSSIRNIRSQETLHSNNFLTKSYNQPRADPKQSNPTDFQADWQRKENGVPKVINHLLTEIKILFRGRQKKQQKIINSLIGTLHKKVSEIYCENAEIHQTITTLEQNIAQLRQQNDQLAKKLKESKPATIQQTNSFRKDQTKAKNYELLIQNLKLSQLNANYLSKINQLENYNCQNKVETRKEVHQNENTEILRHLNRISYLEMKLKNAQEKEVSHNDIIEHLQRNIQQLSANIQNLKEERSSLQQKLSQWRERAQMQMEDSEMHLTRQNFLLYSIKKLREANKGLTQKLLNQASSQNNQTKNEFQPSPYFHYEVDFFKSIKSIYFEAKFKEFKLSLNSRKQDNHEYTSFELEEEYLQYRKYEQVNLSLFTYYMPRFYAFIQQSITNEITNTRIKGNSSVSRSFIQILRAIMKSKLNQFLMLPEEKYTRFPEFVYTWFQKFYFNTEKNDIATLEPYMQKPFSQDLFYRDLMNIKLDQSWQIITFRQFLLEQLSLEELYFYLMCQNLLFRKAGINKAKQYQGDFCILVQYNAAKLVLDLVLSDFQSWNLSYLISKMREKIIYKRNVEYIESGFFLRCLVEYYKIERINRYKYIVKLCDQFKSQDKGLRFSSFISIINRFTEVTIDIKIRLYRECFCLGKGKITADTIFTVCSQRLIFLKYLKLKCFFKLPMVSTHGSRNAQLSFSKRQANTQKVEGGKPIICLQPSEPYLYDIYSKMIMLVRGQSQLHCQLSKLGLVDGIAQFAQMQKIFNEKQMVVDSSVLKCRHFMHFLSELLEKIKVISFTHFYELLEQDNKKRNNQPFWIDIQESQLCQILSDQFKVLLSIYQRLTKEVQWKNKVYEFRLHHAARKIQKAVRKKFIAPYLELYKIIYSEFKNNGDKQTKL